MAQLRLQGNTCKALSVAAFRSVRIWKWVDPIQDLIGIHLRDQRWGGRNPANSGHLPANARKPTGDMSTGSWNSWISLRQNATFEPGNSM